MTPVLSGLDVLCADPSLSGMAGSSIGLLSNVASQSREGRTSLRALRNAGFVVTALFAPEHGYFGLGAAGESIVDESLGGVPIYSLYGAARQPSLDHLRGLDAVLVDLQDLGVRWYTYLATVQHLLRACAQAAVPVILLDRPNPQGGTVVEGLIAEPDYFSLVAAGPFPVRYGLTLGEAAQWLNMYAAPDAHATLTVIPMRGWSRTMYYTDTDQRWNAPSPNMPSPETVLLYTGTCLIEGTNLSEGRGTALPFAQIGAPYIAQPEALAEALNALDLPGVAWRPAWFRPTTSKHTDQRCGGVRAFVIDPRALRGFSVGLHLIATLRRLYPADFGWVTWSTQPDAHNAFDTLAGGSRLRVALEQGQSVTSILDQADAEAKLFQHDAAAIMLY